MLQISPIYFEIVWLPPYMSQKQHMCSINNPNCLALPDIFNIFRNSLTSVIYDITQAPFMSHKKHNCLDVQDISNIFWNSLTSTIYVTEATNISQKQKICLTSDIFVTFVLHVSNISNIHRISLISTIYGLQAPHTSQRLILVPMEVHP